MEERENEDEGNETSWRIRSKDYFEQLHKLMRFNAEKDLDEDFGRIPVEEYFLKD